MRQHGGDGGWEELPKPPSAEMARYFHGLDPQNRSKQIPHVTGQGMPGSQRASVPSSRQVALRPAAAGCSYKCTVSDATLARGLD